MGKRIEHMYLKKDPAPTACPASSTDAAGSLADGAASPVPTIFDLLESNGMDSASVQRVKDACDPSHLELTEEAKRKLTKQE